MWLCQSHLLKIGEGLEYKKWFICRLKKAYEYYRFLFLQAGMTQISINLPGCVYRYLKKMKNINPERGGMQYKVIKNQYYYRYPNSGEPLSVKDWSQLT